MYRYVLFFYSLLLGGCLCDHDNIRYPNLFQPGYLSEQQEHANVFDPFSRSDIGPKIAGDRPSGALDPTPASQRSFYSKSP